MASINNTARSVLVKREAVPGTPETLVAGDAIRDGREFGFLEATFPRVDDANVLKNSFGPGKASHDLGAATQGISLAVPVRAPVADGDLPPDIAELLIACGLAETVNAGTSVVYQPATPEDITAAPAVSMAIYEGGNLHPMNTARANMVLSGQPGQNLRAQFTVRAPWVDPTGDQDIPTVAAPVGTLLQFAGAVAITEDGSTIDIGSLELDLGNQLDDEVTNVGVSVLRSNFNPMIKIDPRAVATVPEWDKLTGGGEIAIVATWNGLVINAPKCQLVEMGSKESAGRIRREKTWQLNETAVDDQFTMTFTAPV